MMTTIEYVTKRIGIRPLGNNIYAFGKKGRWTYDPAVDIGAKAGPRIVAAIRSELKKEEKISPSSTTADYLVVTAAAGLDKIPMVLRNTDLFEQAAKELREKDDVIYDILCQIDQGKLDGMFAQNNCIERARKIMENN